MQGGKKGETSTTTVGDVAGPSQAMTPANIDINILSDKSDDEDVNE